MKKYTFQRTDDGLAWDVIVDGVTVGYVWKWRASFWRYTTSAGVKGVGGSTRDKAAQALIERVTA